MMTVARRRGSRSSVPGCPASAWQPNCSMQASTRSPSSRRPTRSVGTWRDNTYPGLTCDVPSRYYAYSFRPNPVLDPGSCRQAPRFNEYFRRVGDRTGDCSTAYVEFGTNVTAAALSPMAGGGLTTSDRRTRCFDVLDHGHRRAARPALSRAFLAWTPSPGRAFHSSRWDHSVTLPDKRIGLIGTGSTGVQISGRTRRPTSRQLKVFQRTAAVGVPDARTRATRTSPEGRPAARGPRSMCWPSDSGRRYVRDRRSGGRRFEPGWQRRLRGRRSCRWNLRLSVRDPELRRKLTPE